MTNVDPCSGLGFFFCLRRSFGMFNFFLFNASFFFVGTCMHWVREEERHQRQVEWLQHVYCPTDHEFGKLAYSFSFVGDESTLRFMTRAL